MEDVRTESTERMSIILMVASISMLVAITVGMAAEQRNLHKQIQANTVTTRRVLSLFFVGNHILRNGHLRRRLRSKALRQATEQICDIITRNGESHG